MSAIVLSRKGEIIDMFTVKEFPWGSIMYQDGKWYQSVRGSQKALYWSYIDIRFVPKKIRATVLLLS